MKLAFLAAIILHVLLAGFILFHWQQRVDTVTKTGNTVRAYLKLSATDIAQPSSIHHGANKSNTSGILEKAMTSQRSMWLRGQHHRILILLHNALQNYINLNHITLPSFVMIKPVDICFYVNAKRKISQIYIKQNSNYQPLNKFAVIAVKSIQGKVNQLSYQLQPQQYCVLIG